MSVISINDTEVLALIDRGSSVTTISEEFYKSLNPLPELMSVASLNLRNEGAG